jgi:serine/threonine protein kinase
VAEALDGRGRYFPAELPQPGDVILGQYRILGLLGSGNVGVVYSAHQASLERRVALKFVRGAEANPNIGARLVREARAAGRVSDPHVITIFDSGFLRHGPDPTSWVRAESGTPFIVMECLKGVDLETLLNQRTAQLQVADVVSYMIGACKGLAAIHRQGTVHRDIKPANLFLAETDSKDHVVKITDLGVSRFVATEIPDSAPLTRPNELLGSLVYMSPEQVRASSAVSIAADLWSLGVTFYELLSGRLPFDADTEVEVLERILNSEPRPISDFRPNLPQPVLDILSRCLKKNVAERFGSAVSLGQAFERALQPPAIAFTSEAPPPPRSDARFLLRVLRGDGVGSTTEVGRRLTMGRSLGIELPLRDEKASRLHARIERDSNERYLFEDLNSLNGSFVNGVRVTKIILNDGDELAIGNVVFRFEAAEPEPSRPRSGTLRYGGPLDSAPSAPGPKTGPEKPSAAEPGKVRKPGS